MLKKEFLLFQKKENQIGKTNNEKEYFNILFCYYWNSYNLYFKDHNQKRAIEACVAGTKTLEKPMTASEARIFCEKQIKNN